MGHSMSDLAAGVTAEDPAAAEEAGLAARVAALEAEGAALLRTSDGRELVRMDRHRLRRVRE